MNVWHIWHEELEGGVEGVDFGLIEFPSSLDVVAFFSARYPGKHIENFGDEIHVWEDDEGEDLLAGATLED